MTTVSTESGNLKILFWGRRKIFHVNRSEKKAGVAILRQNRL